MIGRRGVVKALESMPGVTVTKRPVLFSWIREQMFCEFEIEGERFEVFEPWGDSNFYNIGPAEAKKPTPQIARIREYFAALEL